MRRFLALDVANVPETTVREMIARMVGLTHNAGMGAANSLAKKLGLTPCDHLRFFLGAPEEWLTDERQRFAESVYCLALKLPMNQAPGRWREGTAWQPVNGRAAKGPIESAALDIEFMRDFGLTDNAWDQALAFSGLIARAKKGELTAGDKVRAYVCLGMLGFPDPLQFFTSEK